MDKIKLYQNIIKNILDQYHKVEKYDFEEFETQLITDDGHGHYLLIDVGWDNMKRKYKTLLHLDIKKDKIWIQKDYTEQGIATNLMEQGIPKSDIVLAFQAPIKRPFTEFAVT